MNRLMLMAVVLVACGACFVAGQVSAEDEPGGGGGMALPEWMQKAPGHECFKKFAGDWDIAQKMWMMPGAPPMESKATATSKLVFDGRFVEMDYKGDMMGQAFDGRLLMAYDRVDEEYVAVWIDSMSAYMSVSRGKEVDGTTTYKMNDPDYMTGKKKPAEMVVKWVDDDTYTLSFIEPTPGGEPKMTMEMTYTRKK